VSQIPLLLGTMGRPANNVTGIVADFASLAGKQFEVARELAPGARRIGFLNFAGTPDGGQNYALMARQAADSLQFTLCYAEMLQPEDVAPALGGLRADGAEAIIVPASGAANTARAEIVRWMAAAQLPAVCGNVQFLEAGGLAVCAADLLATSRRAAYFVSRLLGGVRPADLPAEEASEYTLSLNLRTAKALGVVVSPMLLARATEVIE
jgi:putative ABC transport system substrate-binding protein